MEDYSHYFDNDYNNDLTKLTVYNYWFIQDYNIYEIIVKINFKIISKIPIVIIIIVFM